MDAENFVLQIIGTLPEKKISGKKRLQKFSYFLSQIGGDGSVRFALKDYGPFSFEIAKAVDFLCVVGMIDETEQPIGFQGTYVTEYRLSEVDDKFEFHDNKLRRAVFCLDRFKTVELEVASTIHFFLTQGKDWNAAVRSTEELKPSKTNRQTIDASQNIIKCLSMV